jgi:hypothetical protein
VPFFFHFKFFFLLRFLLLLSCNVDYYRTHSICLVYSTLFLAIFLPLPPSSLLLLSPSSFSYNTSQKSIVTQTIATAPAPAIKKGFLNNAKSTVYPESVTARSKKPVNSINSPAIILPSKTLSEKSENKSLLSSTNGLLRTGGVVSTGSGSMVQELSAEELQQLKKTGTVRRTQGQTQTSALSSSDTLSPSPSVSTAGIPPSPLASAGVGAAQSTGTEKSSASIIDVKNIISSSSSSSSSSGNGFSSPRLTTTTQGPKNDPQSPSNRPQYSLIERGLVSMGDFETLKDKVASNRYRTGGGVQRCTVLHNALLCFAAAVLYSVGLCCVCAVLFCAVPCYCRNGIVL